MVNASSRAYTAALQKKYQAMLRTKVQAESPVASPIQKIGATLPAAQKPSMLESLGSPTNPAGAIIDILSRPVYGVGRFLRETGENVANAQENLAQGRPLNAAGSILGSNIDASLQGLRETIAPEYRELPSEQLLQNWEITDETPTPEKVGRFAAGLGVDIATDPLTYLGVGAIRAAGRAIPGAAALGQKITAGNKPLPKRPLPEKVVEDVPKIAEDVPQVNEALRASIPETVTPSATVPERTGPLQIEPSPPKPSVLLLEAGPLGKKAQAVKAAQESERQAVKQASDALRTTDKISDGTYVYRAGAEGIERAPSEALVWAVNSSGDVSREAARYRYLENIATGEKKPYKPGMLNMQRTVRKYPEVKKSDIPEMFRMPKVELDPHTVARQLGVRGVRGHRDGTPWTLEEFIDYASDKKFTTTVAGMKIPYSELMKLIRQKGNAANTVAARKQVNILYQRYLDDFSRVKAEVQAELEGAETARREAARASRKADRARPVRLEGAELEAVKAKIKMLFDAQDAKTILSKKTPESYQEAVKTALKQTQKKPTFIERVVDSGAARPYSSSLADELFNAPTVEVAVAAIPKTESGKSAKKIFDQAAAAVKPAAEIIDETPPGTMRAPEAIASAGGAEIDDVSALALMYALGPEGQQWAQKAAGFNWETLRMHSARNSPNPGEGLAVNREAFNTMAQTNAWRVMSYVGSQEASKQGLSGLKRSAWLASPEGFDLIGKIKSYERFLRLNGAEPIVSVGKQGWPVGLGDVLDVLYNQAGRTGRSFVERRILTTTGISKRGEKAVSGAFEPSVLLESVRVILDSINPNWTKIDNLEGDIKNLFKRANAKEETISQDFADVLTKGGIKTFTQKTGHVNVTPENAQKVINEAFEAIFNERTVRGLLQAAHTNAANSTLQIVDTVRQLSQDTMTHIVSVLNDRAASIGDAVNALSKIDETVKHAATNNPMHVAPEATKIATQNVTEELPEFVRQADVQSAEHIRKATTAAAKGNKEAVVATNITRHKQAVAEAMEEVPPEMINDGAHMADVAVQAGLMAKMAPFRSKLNDFFISHHGNATLHDSITRGESVIRNMQGAWRRELNAVFHAVRQGKATNEDVVDAFKFLQGRIPNPTPAQQAVIERLQPAVENIFETGRGKAPGIFGAFFREGYDPAHIIEKMNHSRYGLPDDWRFDISKATVNGKIDIESLANQWKGWDVKDPLDFMARMQTVAGSLQLDMSTALEGWRLANTLGYASRTRRVGFVQMPEQSKSVIGRYMPKGAWFDPEILKEIRRMDEILTSSENFSSGFGQFVNKYLDPIMNMWKAGVTVWNPGHHSRNFIGDSSLSFLADGVWNPKYYTRAIQVQAIRSKYTTWDALRALRSTNRTPLAEGAVVARSKNGIQITEEQLFRGMMGRGALPSAAVSEDLLESMASPTITAVQRKMAITGGRAKNIVGRVSEGRDDTVRLAHAMHIIEHGRFKSVEEALDIAAKQVRKWHPDGLSLAPKERQIMRRLFPFYSWTRKTIPLVVESMVLHPGRVLLYPKASYNFAQSQGLDLNSMSDPFPANQLFPSYMTSEVFGPQWQDEQGDYHKMSPGFPSVDILDDFVPNPGAGQTGSDVLRELLVGPINMLTPMIKSPVEAITGTSAGTGGRVHDLGEYFDAQTPGINKISSVTGISPIGTAVNALPGGNAGIDYRRSVEKGNRDPNFSIEALINYLLGLGSMDMSTPSAVNQAEIELRNKLGRERDRQRGM